MIFEEWWKSVEAETLRRSGVILDSSSSRPVMHWSPAGIKKLAGAAFLAGRVGKRPSLVLRISTFAEDANGNEVFLSSGTQAWDISDAGPVANSAGDATGWEVSFRVHHPGVTAYEEIVTMDAIKLLRALEGQQGG